MILRFVAWAIIVVLSLRSFGAVYSAPQEQWNTAVQMVESQAQPGDGVIVYPGYARLPFDYYATKQPAFQGAIPVFPSIAWGQYFPASGPSLETSLADAKQTGRVWVIYRSGDGVVASDAQLLASYLSCGTVQSNAYLQGVEVELIDYPATPCEASR